MNLRATHCAIGITALVLLSALGGCKRSQGGSTQFRRAISFPSDEMIGAVPLGQVAGAPARAGRVVHRQPLSGTIRRRFSKANNCI
jgi:hypothetical protein